MDQHDQMRARNPRDRRDVPDQIVVELEERRIDRVGCADLEQRVAVGRRAHDRFGADIAGASRPVVVCPAGPDALRPSTERPARDVDDDADVPTPNHVRPVSFAVPGLRLADRCDADRSSAGMNQLARCREELLFASVLRMMSPWLHAVPLYGAGARPMCLWSGPDVNIALQHSCLQDASLLSWIRLLTGDATRNAISRRECAKDQSGGMRRSTFCPLSPRHERRAPLRIAADTRLRSAMSRTFARRR
jgi:hypothetical protein